MKRGLAIPLLLLPLLLLQAQGIRLIGKDSAASQEDDRRQLQVVMSSFRRNKANVAENGGKVIASQCKGCIISSQKTRSVPAASQKSHGGDGWFPNVHEDYYGPRNHKPKHHKH